MMKAIVHLAFLFCMLTGVARGQQWMEEAHAAIERGDVKAAVSVVNARLKIDPSDSDALGFHARLLARQGEWAKAEREYKQVLERTPTDRDIVLGLADVLFWQQKNAESLQLLNRAEKSTGPSADVLRRRARVLTVLGRGTEARADYKALLALEPANREANAAVAGSAEARRYELRIGSDTDTFSYTGAANAESIMLRARWNSRWTTLAGTEWYQRFGEDARKVRLGTTIDITRRDYISVGGAFANKQEAISRYDQWIEYGHGFAFGSGFIRGLDASIEQRALWFTSTQVSLFRGGVLLYLPRDWMWSISAAGAHSSFDGAGRSWSPSGNTRLWIPLHERVRANVMFGVGSEDYSNIDQIGSFAAQTYGGGIRVNLSQHQEVSAYGAYQRRTQSRSQMSAGVSYAIRF